MLRHYRVILGEHVINNLQSYRSISNAAAFEILLGIDYKLPEDDTIV
jgi:hypothetical protein